MSTTTSTTSMSMPPPSVDSALKIAEAARIKRASGETNALMAKNWDKIESIAPDRGSSTRQSLVYFFNEALKQPTLSKQYEAQSHLRIILNTQMNTEAELEDANQLSRAQDRQISKLMTTINSLSS